MRGLFLVVVLAASVSAFAGKDVGAFPNGEFEDAAKFGRIDAGAEILAHGGFNGSAGIRIRPKMDEKSYGRQNQFVVRSETFVPARGQKYVLSAVLRAHGDAEVHVAWQAWKDGWCLGHNWNATRTDLGGGWVRYEVALYFTDPDWEGADFRYLLVAGLSSTKSVDESVDSYVDFDCLKIREDEPEWHFANVWPTHNHIYSDLGRIRFHSGYVGLFLPSGGEAAAFRFVLRAADGRTLVERKARPSAPTFTVDFGRLAETGDATLEVTVADAVARKVCGQKTLHLKIVPTPKPKAGEVFVTETGDTLVDGKKFMPLGFFTALGNGGVYDMEKTKRELARIRAAGFNTILEYWNTTFEARGASDFYEALKANGLKLLFNFSGGYKGELTNHLARARRQLAAGAPLLGWYTLDEADFSHLPALRALRHGLNELDPGHPTWQVNIRDIEPYLDVADVLGGDHYLVGKSQGCLKKMDRYLALAASCRPATMWYCPQCFNWANYTKEFLEDREKYLAAEPEPPLNQLLSIVLLYASHGVKGFVFYMYDDIFRGPVPELYEKRWADVCEMGRMLRSLEPFILSGEPIVELPVEDVRGQTRAVALSDGQGHRRVLVIGLDYENEARISLPDDGRGLTPAFGLAQPVAGGRVTFVGGVRSCDLLK